MAIWKSFLELPKEVLNAGILTYGCKLVTTWGQRVWWAGRNKNVVLEHRYDLKPTTEEPYFHFYNQKERYLSLVT